MSQVAPLSVADPAPASWAARLTTVAALILGLGLRVGLLAGGRALWLDEAWLANNITGRSVGQLLAPLDDQQGAPILFLIVERLLWSRFHTDWSLRLLPLVSGCGALVLLPVLGRRFLPPWPLALLATLAAISVPWVYYSSEVKQYSTDLALALGLVLMGLRWHDARTPARAAALVAAGLVIPWASHAATLVFPAVGLAMLVDAVRVRPDRRAVAVTVTAGLLWATSAGVVYLTSLRHLEGDRDLRRYWAAGFPPYSPHALTWAGEAGTEALRLSVGLAVPGLGLVLAIVGGVALWRGRRRPAGTVPALMVLLPFAVALLAAVAHAYPFAGRMVLYLVPLDLLLIVAGVTVVVASADVAVRTGAVAAIPLLALGPARELPALFREPVLGKTFRVTDLGIHQLEDARAVLAHIAADVRPGDQVFLYALAAPPYKYYVGRFPAVAALPTTPLPYFEPIRATQLVLDHVAPGHRAWVYYSEVVHEPGVPTHEDLFTAAANRRGASLEPFGNSRSSLYLVTAAGEPRVNTAARRG